MQNKAGAISAQKHILEISIPEVKSPFSLPFTSSTAGFSSKSKNTRSAAAKVFSKLFDKGATAKTEPNELNMVMWELIRRKSQPSPQDIKTQKWQTSAGKTKSQAHLKRLCGAVFNNKTSIIYSQSPKALKPTILWTAKLPIPKTANHYISPEIAVQSDFGAY